MKWDLLINGNPDQQAEMTVVQDAWEKYGLKLPDGYAGRAVAPSDVIELYSVKGSRFFYCNEEGFYPVAFAAEKAKIKGFY